MYNQIMVHGKVTESQHSRRIQLYAFLGSKYVCYVEVPAHSSNSGEISGAAIHSAFSLAIGQAMDAGRIQHRDAVAIIQGFVQQYRRLSTT